MEVGAGEGDCAMLQHNITANEQTQLNRVC